jgi:ornithine cyclodeaminase/alanine dehydrogenase-like protein (mu-crystallin family)
VKDIEFIYLNQRDVISTGVDMAVAIEAVEDAFRHHMAGKTILPFKTVVDLGEIERGRGNAMPGYVGGDYEALGIKWIAGFPQNPRKHGLPRATGFFILNDSWTGIPLAVMDCTWLSALRTGAVTGVGAKYLARKDSETVAIIGAGVQGRTQLEALLVALPGIRAVRAFDINRQTADRFAEDMSEAYGIDVKAVDSAEDAVVGADVIVTVTVANEPIVKDAWLKRGSYFSAVGSYQEEEFEAVLHSDLVVVDDIETVEHRGTPVVALMLKDKSIARERILELGPMVAGTAPGRTNDDQRVFFSPIGMGIHDICLCHKVYHAAKDKEIGTPLKLFGA